MAVEVIFPRVDMDMRSGRIGRWLAAEGALVEKGDPLFEIETDKASMEIEAPARGVLRSLRAADGDEIAVGAPVAWIVADGEEWAAADGNAVDGAVAVGPPALLRATPLARREAARRGLDLASIAGSGPRGRIVSGDLGSAVLARPKPKPVDVTSATPAAPVAPRQWFRQWHGTGQGAPLVFLHGFGADHTGWRPAWPGLDDTHRLLAIDLPGHGTSSADAAPTLAALVDAVRDVLAEENVARAHLVGHSLGGAVALAFAEATTVDVRSLCLVAPAGLGPEIDGDFIAGFVRAGSPESLAPWLRRLFADPTRASPAFVRAALRDRSGGGRAYQAALAQSLFPDGTQALNLRETLARLSVPVKVIWGLQDAIIPARHGLGLPGPVALHRFAGVGHMPQVETAGPVAALLRQLAREAG